MPKPLPKARDLSTWPDWVAMAIPVLVILGLVWLFG